MQVRIALLSTRVAVTGRRGWLIRWTATGAAKVRLGFAHMVPGKRSVTVGSLTRTVHSGSGIIWVPRKLGKHRLRPGAYDISLTAGASSVRCAPERRLSPDAPSFLNLGRAAASTNIAFGRVSASAPVVGQHRRKRLGANRRLLEPRPTDRAIGGQPDPRSFRIFRQRPGRLAGHLSGVRFPGARIDAGETWCVRSACDSVARGSVARSMLLRARSTDSSKESTVDATEDQQAIVVSDRTEHPCRNGLIFLRISCVIYRDKGTVAHDTRRVAQMAKVNAPRYVSRNPRIGAKPVPNTNLDTTLSVGLPNLIGM